MRSLYLTTLFTFSLVSPLLASSDITLPSGVTVAPGQQAAFLVTLANPAPPGGVFLNLTSSNPSIVSVSPSSVYVSGGKINVPAVTVTGIAVGTATISVSAPNLTGDSQTVNVSNQTATLTFIPQSISASGPGSQKVQLALSTAAPPGGLFVNLTSDNPGVAQVQPSIAFFPDGSSSATNIVPITLVGPGTAVIHASAPSIPDATLTVTVGGSGPPPPGTITLPSGIALAPGQSAPFPVTLSTPAPAGGVTVSLSSSSSSVTVAPSSVSIAAGATTPVTQPQVTGVSGGTSTITATAPGYSQASQQVQVGTSLSFSPTTLNLSSLGVSSLQLNLSSPAPAGGLTVSLGSSNSGAVTVPSSVTFAASATSVSVPIMAVASGTSIISASAPNVTGASASVVVSSNSNRDIIIPSGLTLAPGDQLKFNLTLSKPAPSGGVFVVLSSSDPSKVIIGPVGVFFAEGSTTSPVQPRLTGIDFGSSTITASASGLVGDSEVVLVGTAHGLVPANLTINGLGATQNLTLTLSSPAPAGGITFNLSSSNPSVATVPGSVTVFANASSVTVPVTSVSAGTTVIHSSSLPGFGDVTATVTVVSTGTIGLPTGIVVGPGQSVPFPVTIGTPAPAGGVTITLTSADPTKVSISPGTVTIAAGATTPATQPQVTGVAVGSANITASAPGFTSASQSVQVSTGLSFTPSSLTLNVGAAAFVTLNLSSAIPLTVSLVSSNPGVAAVPSTVTFNGSQTTLSVLVNGVAAGSASITASGPNVTSATLNVSVGGGGGGGTGSISLPANVVLGTNQPVPFPVTLSVPAPAGGVTVSLSSNSPSVTVTPTVTIAAGSVTPATQPQVMGTAYGSATITATAPGYTQASQLVQVSATLSFAPTSLSVTSAGTNNLQLNLSSPAPAGGLAVTLSSSNTAAFTVPSSVTIAANATSVTVPVTAVATGSATITASSNAPNVTSANASASFTSSSPDIILPSGLSLLPGDQLKVSINLAKPAASGGVFVTLASSDTSIFTVLPNSIFIPEGQTTSIRQAQITGVNFGTGSITASASGLNGDTETVRVGSPSGFSPTSLAFSGAGSTQNLQLAIASPAPAGGLVVSLSSTNTAVATVPPTVTFAAGVTSVNVPVTSVGTGSAVIHASGPTLPDTTASITVLTAGSIGVPAISSVSLGEQIPFPITLGTPAPAGGVTVTLSSSLKTSVALSVPSVFIPGGALTPAVQPTLSSFNVGNVTITASAPGYATATRNILSTATVTWSPTSETVTSLGQIRVILSLSAAAPPGTTTAGRCENPDPTTCSVTVALSSDNPNVAQIQSSISYFPDGSSQAINQIAINIVGQGTTLIHAGAPPFIPDTTLSLTVTGPGGPQAPTATAGVNQTVAIGTTVQLSGAGSDPQNLPLTMQWSLTKPANSTAVLSSATIPNPTFVADKSGTYTAQLIVNNGTLSSPPSTVTIATQRPKPIANAGTNQNVLVGATVTLNGGSSTSIDSSPLTYAWILTRPNGSNAVLSGATTVSPTFVADVAGNYTAQLTVNDTFQTSDPATVTIGASGSGASGSITATSGTPQSTGVSQALCAPLVATVLNASNTPVSNVTVTFTAPSNGAGGTFPGGTSATAVTDAFGRATSPVFTTNGTPGSYTVIATAPNTSGSASFSLTNVALPQVNVSAASGTPQSTTVSSLFPLPLVASVKNSTCGNPQSGVTVTFSAPSNGVSGIFAGGNTVVTAISDSNGLATSPAFAANSLTGSYTVSASATGSLSQASFSLTNTQPTIPGSITVSNASVGQNLQTIVTVTLAQPAPAGGLMLNVSSSDPSKVLITPHQFTVGAGSVNIPVIGGLTSAAFFIQGLASSGTVTLTVSTTDNGSGTGTITLSPSGFVVAGPAGLGVPNFATGVGTSSTMTVYSGRLDSSLNFIEPQPLRGGISVNVPVTTSDNNIGSISVSPVAFNGGDNTTAPTQLNALAAGNISVSPGTPITVSQGTPATFSTPANPSLNVSIGALAMTLPNVTVGKDLESDPQQITLNGAATNGGLSITLTSNDPSKVVLSTDPNIAGTGSIVLGIPTGQTHSQTFYVQGLASSGNVTYTASAPGIPDATGTVALTPSGVIIAGPFGVGAGNFLTVTGGPAATITVYPVQLTPGTLSVGVGQRMRPNTSANVNVTSSSTSIGTITTSPITITGGTSSSATSFQPLSQGNTTLSVGIPAGFTAPAQDTTVVANVMKQGISVTDQVTIGNRLEVSGSLVLAQTAPTGGVTVTLTSNDPKLLLSNTATGAGASSIAVVVPANSNNANFYLQGAGSAGTATYTASAAGFQGGTGTVTLAPSGVVISGPFGPPGFQFPVNTKVSSPPTPLSVAVAVLDVNGAYVAQQQLAGGASIVVPVSDFPSSVGTVPVNVTIPGGTSSVTALFTPTTTGTTLVTAGTPSGFSPASSSYAGIQIKVTQ